MTKTNNDIIYKSNCRQVIKTEKCKTIEESDLTGLELGSIASDMRFEHRDGILTIGTIADNYWGGSCVVYDRTTKFNLKDIEKITEFTLFKVGFDDYMQISLNDHMVYVGPDGGSYLALVSRKASWGSQHQLVDNGVSYSNCERGTSWNRDVNIDLRPFLKIGENSINTRVIISGAGEGWLQISVKQEHCIEVEIIMSGIECDYS
jgi:hypothetical protein